jgi:pimeloyl-ACP methyl ester carboxylesterase
VDLPDLRMHVAEAGQGDPLLLLHGWPNHWYYWRELVPALSGQFRLVMPDLRGFGWSDAPGKGYDAETFAADIVALLDALDLDRVKLVGHDWGGFTAFLLGLRYPERIERIVACNAPHPWAPLSGRTFLNLWRTWYAVVAAAPGLGPYLVSRRRPLSWFLGLGRPNLAPDANAVYAERMADPARARASAALYRSYLRVAPKILIAHRFEDERLTVPTRMVFGIEDIHIPPASVVGGERHGDDFQIEYVPGCGHDMPEDCPEILIDRIRKFLLD